MQTETQVLLVIKELFSPPEKTAVSVKEITRGFLTRFGKDYDYKVTPKWMGSFIRKRLGLVTQKSRNGRRAISVTEIPVLHRLYEKYGIGKEEGPERPEKRAPLDFADFDRGI